MSMWHPVRQEESMADAPPTTPVRRPLSRRRGRRAALAALTALAVGATAAPAGAAAPPGTEQTRAAALQEVLFVGNNWAGTADIIRSWGDYARLGRINVVPDKEQRLWEIYLNPIRLAFY